MKKYALGDKWYAAAIVLTKEDLGWMKRFTNVCTGVGGTSERVTLYFDNKKAKSDEARAVTNWLFNKIGIAFRDYDVPNRKYRIYKFEPKSQNSIIKAIVKTIYNNAGAMQQLPSFTTKSEDAAKGFAEINYGSGVVYHIPYDPNKSKEYVEASENEKKILSNALESAEADLKTKKVKAESDNLTKTMVQSKTVKWTVFVAVGFIVVAAALSVWLYIKRRKK